MLFSFCSGFLLSTNPPWLGTAAHCTDGDLDSALVIFGFEVISSDGSTRLNFDANAVYGVNRVVVQGTPSGAENDYGIFELDRVVTGYIPYTAVNGNVNVGDQITLIGHPTGLPKKFDSGGEVRVASSELIGATCDSYGGNSGSPIFDVNHRLIGILVGGAPDFVGSGCDSSNVCPGGLGCTSDGENIVPICELLLSSQEVINQLGLCGADDDFDSTEETTDFSTFYTTDLSTFTTDLSTFFTTDLSTFFSTFSSFTNSFSTFTFSVFSSFSNSFTSFTSIVDDDDNFSSSSSSGSSSDSTMLVVLLPNIIISLFLLI